MSQAKPINHRILIRPHRRYNPLTGNFVLVSPQRASRPWQGKLESLPSETRPVYDPTCYLCPGNVRSKNVRNPHYSDIYIFPNDFPALLEDTPGEEEFDHPLFKAFPAKGKNRVICFSPRHDLTLAQMDVQAIKKVIEAQRDLTPEEAAKKLKQAV